MSDENIPADELLNLPGDSLAEQLRARLASEPADAEARALLADLQQLRLPQIEPAEGFEQRLALRLAALPPAEQPQKRLARWPLALSAAAAVAAILFLAPQKPEPVSQISADRIRADQIRADQISAELMRMPLPSEPYGLNVPRQSEPALHELSAGQLAYPPAQIHASPVPL